MPPKYQTLLALAAVGLFGLFIYSITSWQTALLYTSAALVILV